MSPNEAGHYNFDLAQYKVEKLRPPSRGLSAPLDDWSRSNLQTFEFPRDPEGQAQRVQDSYTVLTSLAKLGLDAVGDSATTWIASSRGPQQWRISVEERARRKVVLKGIGRSGKQKLYVSALRLSLKPESAENVDADILGLEGEVELWIEAQSKTLLLLSGKIPRVPGRVSLKLIELN